MFQLEIIRWTTIVFVIFYIPRLLCWFAPLRKQKRLTNRKQNRFAVIIPARNEGLAVMPLFRSILAQTYDNNLFDTYVVVKEKNDPVREYANMVHATVYVDETQKCKGDCLDYCIKAILRNKSREYDGYIIIDADCTLDAHFLDEMNHAMASGAQVINAKKLVKNYYSENKKDTTIITACNGLIWTLMDDMGNRFKSDHGYTTMTITTGILIRKDLIESWQGWNYCKTLTEDMELQRDCGVQGYKTFYYSYAKIYMEEAPSHVETNKRRTRWMTGIIAADRLYASLLLRKRCKHQFWDNYYLFCLWNTYLFIGGLYAIASINLFGVCLLALFHKAYLYVAVRVAFTAISVIYVAFLIMTGVAIITDWNNIKLSPMKKLQLWLIHPLFYMEYIKIVAKAIFFKSTAEWEEIKRAEVNT